MIFSYDISVRILASQKKNVWMRVFAALKKLSTQACEQDKQVQREMNM
jgi:hypothetical protein